MRFTIYLPDTFKKDLDDVKNKSEYFQNMLESLPALVQIGKKQLCGKFTFKQAGDLLDSFFRVPFVAKLANMETIKSLVKDAEILKIVSTFNEFEVFLLIYMINLAYVEKKMLGLIELQKILSNH